MKLSEGQGAELIWRDSRNKRLTPADALKIYSLKTAPAFEAALHTGLRLAGRRTDIESRLLSLRETWAWPSRSSTI